MAAIDDMTLRLSPDSFFHVYNRGNNGIPIFYQEKNYFYFLKKYGAYMKDYWDTFAYCLLENHFHLLVKVKPQNCILETGTKDFSNVDKKFFKKLFPAFDMREFEERPEAADLLNFQNLVNLPPHKLQQLSSTLTAESLHKELACWAVSERFRRMLLGYAKAINRQEDRSGSLFQKLFKRKLVESEEGCKNVVAYIHRNGVHHKICSTIEEYPWSSYLSILSSKPTLLKRQTLLDWFGGVEEYKKFHQLYVEDWKYLQKFINRLVRF